MPLHSSDARLVAPPSHAREDGPVLECSRAGEEAGDQPLRIRVRRQYPASREALFAAWTERTGWDGWMRLRARSRASVAACPGGAFRLELAEGPAIHVITGSITSLRAPEQLSLSWMHHDVTGQESVVDVSLRARQDMTELVLVHSRIGSRREAAWLMRLWATVLDRLGECVTGHRPVIRSLSPSLSRAWSGGHHLGS